MFPHDSWAHLEHFEHLNHCSFMRLSEAEPYTLPQEEQQSSASLKLSFLALETRQR